MLPLLCAEGPARAGPHPPCVASSLPPPPPRPHRSRPPARRYQRTGCPARRVQSPRRGQPGCRRRRTGQLEPRPPCSSPCCHAWSARPQWPCCHLAISHRADARRAVARAFPEAAW
eukprot:scaffold9111_cov46-Phaeocystis_antarctica.AAC.2